MGLDWCSTPSPFFSEKYIGLGRPPGNLNIMAFLRAFSNRACCLVVSFTFIARASKMKLINMITSPSRS